jgi:predicted nucleic acid-binding protein
MTVLADTSAWITVQRRGTPTFALVEELVEGDLWTCTIVRLELLRGAPNPRAMRAVRAQLDEVPSAPIDDEVWQRAEEVYAGLARLKGGRHRAVGPADVLVAAAAEAHELLVLHDDAHFDLIAEVTGQEVLRLP